MESNAVSSVLRPFIRAAKSTNQIQPEDLKNIDWCLFIWGEQPKRQPAEDCKLMISFLRNDNNIGDAIEQELISSWWALPSARTQTRFDFLSYQTAVRRK